MGDSPSLKDLVLEFESSHNLISSSLFLLRAQHGFLNGVCEVPHLSPLRHRPGSLRGSLHGCGQGTRSSVQRASVLLIVPCARGAASKIIVHNITFRSHEIVMKLYTAGWRVRIMIVFIVM